MLRSKGWETEPLSDFQKQASAGSDRAQAEPLAGLELDGQNRVASPGADTDGLNRAATTVTQTAYPPAVIQPDAAAGANGSRFVRACLRQPVDRTPVWFLRQAGRYMPEYMAVRKHHSLLDICRTPDIAAEVTITAAERLGVDAAIIFADLLLPFTPMGLDFEFVNGEGPVVHNPIRTLEQIQSLRTDRADDLLYVSRAIEKVVKHFNTTGSRNNAGGSSSLQATESPASHEGALAPAPMDTLGIIGFCGAPFTLASYMIEGGSSRNYI